MARVRLQTFWWPMELGSQDLSAALPMRRRIIERSMASILTKMEMHGGLSKTGGAADAIDERTPASFSVKGFEKASAVSSSEFGGLSFFCRGTDFKCRHSFYGWSPLLSVISSSRFNSVSFLIQLLLLPGLCSPSQPIIDQPSHATTLFQPLVLRLAAAQSASNQAVGWWRAVCSSTWSGLVQESLESGVVQL